MPTEPLVCAFMLTRDRPAMAARAVRSFLAQTYANVRLYVYDTGDIPAMPEWRAKKIGVFYFPEHQDKSIGALRNIVCESISGALRPPDIFLHWDDDDYSHPNRIAEQVALLQSSGADAVGYREMLFWDTRPNVQDGMDALDAAWLFTHRRPDYVIGTSLCYWRRTWERRMFKDVPHGQVTGREDSLFIQGLKVASEPSSGYMTTEGPGVEPSMVASIHGGNSQPYDTNHPQWKRVPEWDEYCRKVMAL